MFEVVLKQDYEDIYFFREFEVNGITNGSVIDLRDGSGGRRSPMRYSSGSRSRKSPSPNKYSANKSLI